MRFFWVGHFGFFFSKKKIFFCLIPWKIVKGSWIARMGQNFDDYPGFQPVRSWANTYAQDCTSSFFQWVFVQKLLCTAEFHLNSCIVIWQIYHEFKCISRSVLSYVWNDVEIQIDNLLQNDFTISLHLKLKWLYLKVLG